ncbi:MAG: CHAP domain-containing protein [bacterium]|nr:CHAP domain-containing protein [bacterium]
MPAPRSSPTAFLPLLVLPAPLVGSRPGLPAGPSANALPAVKRSSQQATATVDELVAAHQQGGMQKIVNGTRDVPPRPGDLLTHGPTTTYGHTSVVRSTNLDGSGSGTITAVEENDRPGGSSTSTVSGWTVQALEPVTGRLRRI